LRSESALQPMQSVAIAATAYLQSVEVYVITV